MKIEEKNRGYAIALCPADQGGGWKLTLFRNNAEVSSKVFSLSEERRQTLEDWQNKLDRRKKLSWMPAAGTSVPDDVRHVYLLCMAHANALNEANSWMNTGCVPQKETP